MSENSTLTPQNATRADFMRQIDRLQFYLYLIANLPLEFNTRARALAQEGLEEEQLVKPEARRLMWRDIITPQQRDNILRRGSVIGQAGILPPRESKDMDSTQKTSQEQKTDASEPKQIDMIEVESSNVARIGHDGENTLRVEYKSNPADAWDFQGVTAGEFIDLYQADSVGVTLNQLTRNRGIKGEKQIGIGGR